MHKKIPPGLQGERCCAVLRLGGYHHGKPDLDLFAGVIGKAGGDQADLAFIGQSGILCANAGGVAPCIQVDCLLSGILVVLAAVEVDDLIIGDNAGLDSETCTSINRLDNSFKSGARCQALQLGIQFGRGGKSNGRLTINAIFITVAPSIFPYVSLSTIT